MQQSKRKSPLSHNNVWRLNHQKILNALNNGCKTSHEIFMKTNIQPPAILRHKKEIIECPKCHKYNDINLVCDFCGFSFNETMINRR